MLTPPGNQGPAAPEEPRYLRPGGNRRVRRRRQRRTALVASIWCAAWLAGAGLAAFGFRTAWLLLVDPDRFPLRQIVVEGAGETIDREVEAKLQPLLGKNVLTIDIAEVQRAAAGNPWVRGSSVRRRLPSTILVLVEPRKTLALVQAADGIHMTDAEGFDIGRYGPRYAGVNHAILTGVVGAEGRVSRARVTAGIRALQALESRAPEFSAGLSTLDVSRADRVTATLRDFVTPIYLSPEDPAKNLGSLGDVRLRLSAAGIGAEYIDLRFRGEIAVMPDRTGEKTSGA
ncbi:MAG: FtsQ-type POTRA domain-containing protein [Acidobacteria bacterium]|nr:FtsQ-type POTRA domain-containing protein [Acidobacteriota bacterium]